MRRSAHPLYEHGRHEGNCRLYDILAGARAASRAAGP